MSKQTFEFLLFEGDSVSFVGIISIIFYNSDRFQSETRLKKEILVDRIIFDFIVLIQLNKSDDETKTKIRGSVFFLTHCTIVCIGKTIYKI